MSQNVGRVVQVIGPVIDSEFPHDNIPRVRNRLEISVERNGQTTKVISEVAMQLEGNIVRSIAITPTEGVRRGSPVVDIQNTLTVPVGEATLGRLFNVLGEPLDNKGELKDVEYISVRRDAPPFEVIQVDNQTFETGIKVIDLIAPYIKGGKT
ncbi:F0F1 ATP synthase subunit beta, partial [bacterium]|nr:F0F1 ATP synthase subunit beta [bacterium]